MAHSTSNHFDEIIARRIRSGKATNRSEVIHQALELLDTVSRGRGPETATFFGPEDLEEMVFAGFESGPATPMTSEDWEKLRGKR